VVEENVVEGREGGVVEKLRLAYIYSSLIMHVKRISSSHYISIKKDFPLLKERWITNVLSVSV
jgi:hypothetical protein